MHSVAIYVRVLLVLDLERGIPVYVSMYAGCMYDWQHSQTQTRTKVPAARRLRTVEVLERYQYSSCGGASTNCLGRDGRGSLRLSRVRLAAQLSVCDAAFKIPKAPTAKIWLLPLVSHPSLPTLCDQSLKTAATRPVVCRANHRYVLCPAQRLPICPFSHATHPLSLQTNHLSNPCPAAPSASLPIAPSTASLLHRPQAGRITFYLFLSCLGSSSPQPAFRHANNSFHAPRASTLPLQACKVTFPRTTPHSIRH